MTGILAPGHYTAFPLSLSSSGSWVWVEDRYGLHSYSSSLVNYPSSSNHANEAWSRDDADKDVWKWTNRLTPGDETNSFPPQVAVNQCTGLRLSEISANVDTDVQFIEVSNKTDTSIQLEGCVLQTNRSKVSSHVFGAEELAPDEYRTVYIKDTGLTLTKTTSGTVYVLSSDLVSEVDQVSYDGLLEGTSWSLIGDKWLQSYTVSPGTANVRQDYEPCETGHVRNTESGRCNKIVVPESLADCGEGKYRSEETNRCRTITMQAALAACGAGKYRNTDTNRCRNIATATSLLKPCVSNQERNPLTNRCRLISSTASTLKPCASNQQRNPATNRCRLIGAGGSSLKPCAANQERNPATNRCRKKVAGTVADFPVEAVAESGKATVGWWAFGGVGILAAGYAGWEWRREVMSLIKRFSPFGIGRL